jgi:hypothetical protein
MYAMFSVGPSPGYITRIAAQLKELRESLERAVEDD